MDQQTTIVKDEDIDTQYDEILKRELTKRLNRSPLPNELTNGDTDNDLVAEVFWQLIKSLSIRIKALEDKP